jgi:hypothetical protein
MTLTPEQQLLLPELEAHNANITRSNEAAAAHNEMLPPGMQPVPIRPLLTMAEFIQYKLDQAAEAEARRVQAASKTNEQWQAEWTATKLQLDAVEADKESIEAARLQLVSDLAAKTTAYDTEVVKVTTLEAEKATLTTQKATLTEQLTQANATIATLQARRAALEAIRQFNPRWTTPDFFQNRFTVKTARMFERSDDPVIAGGRDLLDEYELRGYHVDLDDAQVQGLTAYMVQLGMLTEQERTHVLRDATAAEAWYPQ